jgi:FkbM family methyltransferase
MNQSFRRRMCARARDSSLGRGIRTSLAVVPRQRLACSWFELRAHGTARTWLLKGTRRPVTVRSGTRDQDVLREIFVDGGYALPPAVEDILGVMKSPKIVDLGANIGLFGLWALARWPQARIHSFEPDAENLAVLDRNIDNAGIGPRWSVTRACAAPADGTAQFLAGRQADSRVVYDRNRSSDLPEVPAVDVFPHLQDADLLKIDIEGGEWPLLTDARFRELSVPAIVLEFHTYNCPEPADSAQAAASLLEASGYTVLETHRDPTGVGTIWAWRDLPRS